MRATLVALLIAAAAKMLADEIKEWMNWLPPKLIRWASSITTLSVRDCGSFLLRRRSRRRHQSR
jgi:hypothetical protein